MILGLDAVSAGSQIRCSECRESDVENTFLNSSICFHVIRKLCKNIIRLTDVISKQHVCHLSEWKCQIFSGLKTVSEIVGCSVISLNLTTGVTESTFC